MCAVVEIFLLVLFLVLFSFFFFFVCVCVSFCCVCFSYPVCPPFTFYTFLLLRVVCLIVCVVFHCGVYSGRDIASSSSSSSSSASSSSSSDSIENSFHIQNISSIFCSLKNAKRISSFPPPPRSFSMSFISLHCVLCELVLQWSYSYETWYSCVSHMELATVWRNKRIGSIKHLKKAVSQWATPFQLVLYMNTRKNCEEFKRRVQFAQCDRSYLSLWHLPGVFQHYCLLSFAFLVLWTNFQLNMMISFLPKMQLKTWVRKTYEVGTE